MSSEVPYKQIIYNVRFPQFQEIEEPRRRTNFTRPEESQNGRNGTNHPTADRPNKRTATEMRLAPSGKGHLLQ